MVSPRAAAGVASVTARQTKASVPTAGPPRHLAGRREFEKRVLVLKLRATRAAHLFLTAGGRCTGNGATPSAFRPSSQALRSSGYSIPVSRTSALLSEQALKAFITTNAWCFVFGTRQTYEASEILPLNANLQFGCFGLPIVGINEFRLVSVSGLAVRDEGNTKKGAREANRSCWRIDPNPSTSGGRGIFNKSRMSRCRGSPSICAAMLLGTPPDDANRPRSGFPAVGCATPS